MGFGFLVFDKQSCGLVMQKIAILVRELVFRRYPSQATSWNKSAGRQLAPTSDTSW